MEYTKGEWWVYNSDISSSEYFIELPHKQGERAYHEIGFAYKREDAVLMAAAPDMYEFLVALKEIALPIKLAVGLLKVIYKAEGK